MSKTARWNFEERYLVKIPVLKSLEISRDTFKAAHRLTFEGIKWGIKILCFKNNYRPFSYSTTESGPSDFFYKCSNELFDWVALKRLLLLCKFENSTKCIKLSNQIVVPFRIAKGLLNFVIHFIWKSNQSHPLQCAFKSKRWYK